MTRPLFFFFLKHVEEVFFFPRTKSQPGLIYIFVPLSKAPNSRHLVSLSLLFCFFPLFRWLSSRLIPKSSLCRAVAHCLLYLSCYWTAKKMGHQLEKVAPAVHLHNKQLLYGKNMFKYFFADNVHVYPITLCAQMTCLFSRWVPIYL